jgi:5,10-methylenetetrahydrofolate reductase
MSLREVFASGKFAITGEIGPPKGIDIKGILEEAEHYYKGRVNAVNVTDIQSSVMRLGSLPVCHLLKDREIEPVFQMVCRDRNRLALQSDLLNAAVLGVENILCLTGDYTTLGDHPQAKPVFDLDSVQLLQAAKGLEGGQDMVGNKLQGSPKFFLGAVVNPGVDPLEPQIMKMEKKVKAGAQFFQTQAVYEPKKFEKFMKAVEYLKTPVMVGIVLLKSAGMAKYMNENVAGVFVPEELIKEIKEVSKEDRPQKSVEIAARLIKEMKDMCQGVHLMPLGWDKYVPQILDAAGLY